MTTKHLLLIIFSASQVIHCSPKAHHNPCAEFDTFLKRNWSKDSEGFYHIKGDNEVEGFMYINNNVNCLTGISKALVLRKLGLPTKINDYAGNKELLSYCFRKNCIDYTNFTEKDPCYKLGILINKDDELVVNTFPILPLTLIVN